MLLVYLVDIYQHPSPAIGRLQNVPCITLKAPGRCNSPTMEQPWTSAWISMVGQMLIGVVIQTLQSQPLVSFSSAMVGPLGGPANTRQWLLFCLLNPSMLDSAMLANISCGYGHSTRNWDILNQALPSSTATIRQLSFSLKTLNIVPALCTLSGNFIS